MVKVLRHLRGLSDVFGPRKENSLLQRELFIAKRSVYYKENCLLQREMFIAKRTVYCKENGLLQLYRTLQPFYLQLP